MAEFQQLIERERGKIVLVDFWATWCPPCVALFPHTVALQQKYGGRGLTVVTVSMDSPEDEAKVRSFLQSRAATKTLNFIARDGGSARAFRDFDIDDGAIPHLKVFDRQGRLREKLIGPRPDDVDKAVEHLLGDVQSDPGRS